VSLDETALRRIDESFARAEDLVRRSEEAAQTRRRVNDSYDRRIDKAYAATERAIESIKPPRVGLALRIAAWRRRRRHRRTVARLQRALTRKDLRVADRSSAALLAIVTERIARMSSTNALPHEMAEAIELTERIVADYVRQIDVIDRHARELARPGGHGDAREPWGCRGAHRRASRDVAATRRRRRLGTDRL